MNFIKNPHIIYLFILTFISFSYSQERIIKPGDAIAIAVYGQEELNQTVTVSPEGTIDFPALQDLPVDGITIQRFRELLVAQLSRYMERTPLVTIRFVDQYPIRITVLGQVKNPGLHTILNTSTIQGAITVAGGFVTGAQLSKIMLVRTENGKMSNHTVNMEHFYRSGDPNQLPDLKNGDSIVVPGNPLASTVKVLGSVKIPGNYEVSFQTALLDLLYMAGGPTTDANLNNIKIGSIADQNMREISINIQELLKSENFQSMPIVVPGDIIYVPEKKITWRKVVSFIRDITPIVMIYYFIDRTVER